MDFLQTAAEWAWARHHNVLSWYIRPLFLIPFCYFAYRRSLVGIFATLFALLTSMFWFSVPEHVAPAVLTALQAEKDYLLGPWAAWKVAIALLVPLSLAGLAAAFWRRSFMIGVIVINAIAVLKLVWTFGFLGSEAGFALLVPALTGLAICNAAVIWWLRRRKEQHQ